MDALSTQIVFQNVSQNQLISQNESQVPGSTLLMLVMSTNESTDSADETVEAVHHLLDTDQVRLTGNFRGTRLRDDVQSSPSF